MIRYMLTGGLLILLAVVVSSCEADCVPSPTQVCDESNDNATSRLSVSVTTGVGNGTITSLPAGINCVTDRGVSTGSCVADFPTTALVNLSAVAGENTVFDGWSGDCQGNSGCQLEMTQDRTAVALLPMRAVIGVTGAPTLSFTTTVGVDPPPQTKGIANQGEKSLEWSASFNQTWILVSPLASGTLNPGESVDLTVSVDASGLAVGTHQGVITLLDPEAANSPREITIDVTVS